MLCYYKYFKYFMSTYYYILNIGLKYKKKL